MEIDMELEQDHHIVTEQIINRENLTALSNEADEILTLQKEALHYENQCAFELWVLNNSKGDTASWWSGDPGSVPTELYYGGDSD